MNIRYQLPDKETIRKSMLSFRHQYYAGKLAPVRQRFWQQLNNLQELRTAQRILLYASFDNEVDTFDLIKNFLADGRSVFLPKIFGRDLKILPITDLRQLEKNQYGIYEPPEDLSQDVNSLDVVIVPGVAFDHDGYRLGFGYGYYDRLLANYQGITIGLAYSWQIVQNLPHDSSDIRVQYLVSENQIRKITFLNE